MLTSYTSNGFAVAADAIVSADVIDDAVNGAEKIMSGKYDTGFDPPKSKWKAGDDPKILRKVNLPQLSSQSIRNLLNQPALGEFAHEVSGAKNIQVWWSQLIYKPPGQESSDEKNQVTCHQDSTYEQDWSATGNLFTLWIALSDVIADSGPLQYLRGSHKIGPLKRDISYSSRHMHTKGNYNPYCDPKFEEATVVLKSGQVTCHHRHIFHGSGPNLSKTERMSIALHLCADGSQIVNRSPYTEQLENLEICPGLYGDPALAKTWLI